MYRKRNFDVSQRHQRTKEVYLDDPLNTDWDGNELSWLDVLPASEGDGVYQVLEEETDKNLLKAALLKLEPREQEIVTLRFGIGIDRELTQKKWQTKWVSPVVYFPAGKADYEETASRTEKVRIKNQGRLFRALVFLSPGIS